MVVFIKTQPILKVLIMLFFLPYSMQKIILFCTARRIHPINFESPVRHFHGLKKLRIVSNQPFLILLLSIVKVGSELIYSYKTRAYSAIYILYIHSRITVQIFSRGHATRSPFHYYLLKEMCIVY